MRRSGFAGLGMGSWMVAVGMLAVAAAPVMAGDFSIGAMFAGGKHGGTVIGGFLRLGQPSPRVVAQPVIVTRPPVMLPPPVIVERVWVSTPRIEYRQVPVLDVFGRVIAYRQESVTIPDGYWQTVTRPAPVAHATAVVLPRYDRDRGYEGRNEHRDGRRR